MDTAGIAADRIAIDGDARRLTQLFNNLFENTLRYTDRGGRVKIGRQNTSQGVELRSRIRRQVCRPDCSRDCSNACSASRVRAIARSAAPAWVLPFVAASSAAITGDIEASASSSAACVSGFAFHSRETTVELPRDSTQSSWSSRTSQSWRHFWRTILRADGFAPRCVGDGNSAIVEARKNEASLMLLDLMLPGKDGLTVCREVRSFNTLPIIMVTARVE